MVDGQGQAAAAAIRRALDEHGQSQEWLARAVAREEGRSRPFSQSLVSGWLLGAPISPSRMFTIERVLGVEPGSISRLAGFLPADARPQISVPDALASDPDITKDQRAVLLAAYQAARRVTRSKRT